MQPDPDLHIRDAATGDTTSVAELLTRAAADTGLAQWLHPNAQARGRHLDTLVRILVGERIAAASVRIAVGDRQLLGACVWTTCAATDQPSPPPDDLLLGHDGDAQRTRLLQQQLTQRHPTESHDHLLLLGVRPGSRWPGIDAALLADWHQQPTNALAGRYLLAPDTLTSTAADLGYHPLEPITASITAPRLYPKWRPIPSADPPTAGRRPGTQPASPHRSLP